MFFPSTVVTCFSTRADVLSVLSSVESDPEFSSPSNFPEPEDCERPILRKKIIMENIELDSVINPSLFLLIAQDVETILLNCLYNIHLEHQLLA